MEMRFLGTGAADWGVQHFVDGQEYRRWSSALIDGDLLIDPGPHIFHFVEKNSLDGLYDGVKNMIVTHSHNDHFSADTVKVLAENGAALWGEAACLRKLRQKLGDDADKIVFNQVTPYSDYKIGDYNVKALPSNHGTGDPEETTLHYVIEKDGKRLFYGPDGAWLFYPVWRIIREMKFDAMVLEATIGDVPGDDRIFGHNNLDMIEIMLQTFRTQGCLGKDGKVYLSHLARTLHPAHAEVVKRCERLDATPAYDGMIIKI